jgi:hypothetical protein
LRRYGQREAESCAALRGVFDPDALSMGFDEGLGDGQAEAGAGVAFPTGEQPEDLVRRSGLTPGPWSVTDSSIVAGAVEQGADR